MNTGKEMNLAFQIKMLKEKAPHIWEDIHQKVYRNVDGFEDYKWSLVRKAHLLYSLENGLIDQKKPSIIESQLFLSYDIARLNNFPMFFVSRALFLAAAATDTLSEIDIQSLPLPFESFVFVLPKSIYKIGGNCILCFEIRRTPPGRFETPTGIAIPKLPNLHFAADGRESSFFSNMEGTYFRDRELKPSQINFLEDIKDSKKEAVGRMTQIIFNLLFAMAAKPEYIENGFKIGRVKKGKQELWTPNVIGRKYQYKKSETKNGSHESPRTHWRRGHFRQQACGRKREQFKTIWIEPMLINA